MKYNEDSKAAAAACQVGKWVRLPGPLDFLVHQINLKIKNTEVITELS
jgi:hypothetical protein